MIFAQLIWQVGCLRRTHKSILMEKATGKLITFLCEIFVHKCTQIDELVAAMLFYCTQHFAIMYKYANKKFF